MKSRGLLVDFWGGENGIERGVLEWKKGAEERGGRGIEEIVRELVSCCLLPELPDFWAKFLVSHPFQLPCHLLWDWQKDEMQTQAPELSKSGFSSWLLEITIQWHPTPVFLPGESQGRGSLVGCSLWGHTESDTTEVP